MKTLAYNTEHHTLTTKHFTKDTALTTLQHIVNGNIEHITPDFLAGTDIDMWVNAEYLVNDLPYAFTARVNGQPTPIFGNVAFTRVDDMGDTIGLTDDDIRMISNTL